MPMATGHTIISRILFPIKVFFARFQLCSSSNSNAYPRVSDGSCDNIYESLLYRPYEWTPGAYTLRHNNTGIELWTCNGRAFFEVYRPEQYSFSIPWKVRLWPLARAICNGKSTSGKGEVDCFVSAPNITYAVEQMFKTK